MCIEFYRNVLCRDCGRLEEEKKKKKKKKKTQEVEMNDGVLEEIGVIPAVNGYLEPRAV
ncbi:unnamed protein product [Fusarium venenatum]|uniref:Uncharacterized protein n=1 Tax=Fusarium venenatum TaxID=56646 RepID=A0A2L2SU98_9HYPO|nr:uncharacterized protein FVRRES_13931 [Fusarium venenatum]CEI42193.1 unnamed protein product [Fusarium venenatum]